MHIYDLVIQIFMAASFIAGTTMLVFTIGYRDRLRRVERIGRYILGTLLVYSVTIRFLMFLPNGFAYMQEASIGFDILYISMCLFYNINILGRNGR
jgi:hypothetical protein